MIDSRNLNHLGLVQNNVFFKTKLLLCLQIKLIRYVDQTWSETLMVNSLCL